MAKSFSVSSRTTLAGVPNASDLAGMTVPGMTHQPAPTMASSPIRAPFRMMAPMPIKCPPFDMTPMDGHPVTEDDIVFQHERVAVACHMEDAGVLDVAASSHSDGVDIPTHKAEEPDIGLGSQLYIADNQSIVGNKNGRIDFGRIPLKSSIMPVTSRS